LTWNVHFGRAGAGTSLECLGQVRLSRSSSQGQGHRSKIVFAVCGWPAFD